MLSVSQESEDQGTEDIVKLAGLAWLNDMLLISVMNMVIERSKDKTFPKDNAFPYHK